MQSFSISLEHNRICAHAGQASPLPMCAARPVVHCGEDISKFRGIHMKNMSRTRRLLIAVAALALMNAVALANAQAADLIRREG